MKGWIDLFVNRILPDVVGPTAAPVVFAMMCLFLAALGMMPFMALWTARQVGKMRGALVIAEEKLDRLSQRHVEMHGQVKESFALVQERLANVPPPVRFGPGGKDGAPEATAGATAEETPGTIPEGQGVYNYCPGCKEIRFIKFFRCQTCGFHVPR